MLRFNEQNDSFILFTNDVKRAESAGLALSKNIRGPNGERVYFTSDHSQQPTYNPYAVLEFYDEADDKARSHLNKLYEDYQASWADAAAGHFDAPYDKEFMPYQKAGMRYALDRGNTIIGDEPGLGKTIQAIGLANTMQAERILVVCPASIRRNWRREISEWHTMRKGCAVNVIEKGSQGVSPHANYTVVSYDLLRNEGIHKALRRTNFDLAITDEGHYLKTPEAQRTRAVFGGGERPKNPAKYSFYENGLDRNCELMVSMTGTLLPNRPREAYTITRGLNWEAIDYLAQEPFLYRYNPSMQKIITDRNTGEDRVINVEDRGRLAELNARLRCNLMVRRLKKDVLPQLPDKRYEMTYIEPDGAISKVLAKESMIDFNPYDLFNSDFTLDGTPISTLRREMGEAMVPRVVDYMKYLLDIVELPKVVLFAHHTSVILALAEALDGYGVKVHRGGSSDTVKDDAKASFISGSPRIFLGQLDTMEGVDGLQSVSSDVVFAEPAWTPGRNEQCVDRCHRYGQHDNVVAHFLLVEGSFNEKVLNVVLEKAVDIHESLDRRVV